MMCLLLTSTIAFTSSWIVTFLIFGKPTHFHFTLWVFWCTYSRTSQMTWLRPSSIVYRMVPMRQRPAAPGISISPSTCYSSVQIKRGRIKDFEALYGLDQLCSPFPWRHFLSSSCIPFFRIIIPYCVRQDIQIKKLSPARRSLPRHQATSSNNRCHLVSC